MVIPGTELVIAISPCLTFTTWREDALQVLWAETDESDGALNNSTNDSDPTADRTALQYILRNNGSMHQKLQTQGICVIFVLRIASNAAPLYFYFLNILYDISTTCSRAPNAIVGG